MAAARFRLIGKHYLNVPGTEWEQKESDRINPKRQVRKVYSVPMFLDPNEPADCNYPGEIIVATEPSAQFPNDIIFSGDPTADMEPLNEAAEAIIERIKGRWINPIESLQTTYGEAMLHDLQRQVAEAQTKTGGKPIDIILTMKKQMEDMQREITELRSQQAPATANPAVPATTSRRA